MVFKALVEATKNVEDEDLVIDRQPQVGWGIGHALELAAILSHREITLCKIVKSSIEVKSMCPTITEELVLHGEPQVARGTATLSNDLLKIGGEHVGEPIEDDNIHPGPRRIVDEGVIGQDVDGEEVPCQGHQH
jgi:hypothetical protein